MAVEPARAVAMDAARRASPSRRERSWRVVSRRRCSPARKAWTSRRSQRGSPPSRAGDGEGGRGRARAIGRARQTRRGAHFPRRGDARARCDRGGVRGRGVWCWYALAHPATAENSARTRHERSDTSRVASPPSATTPSTSTALSTSTTAAAIPPSPTRSSEPPPRSRPLTTTRPPRPWSRRVATTSVRTPRVPLPDVPGHTDDAAGTGTGTGTTTGTVIGTVVRPIPSDDPRVALRGRLGLFASRDWSPGETVSEYAGALHPRRVRATFAGAFAARAAHRAYAVVCEGTLAGVPGPLMICAFDPKFANDRASSTIPSPSRRARGRRAPRRARERSSRRDARRRDRGAPRLFVVTTRHVRAGEEFLATYGDAFWEEEDAPRSRMKTRHGAARRRQRREAPRAFGDGRGSETRRRGAIVRRTRFTTPIRCGKTLDTFALVRSFARHRVKSR